MGKRTLSAAVSPKTMERVDEYAEKEQITRSEATARLLKHSLDLKEDKAHIVSTDGGETQEQLNEINSRLDEIENLADGSDEVEPLATQLQDMLLPITIALLWIGVEVTIGIPLAPVGAAITGIPLIVWLIYVYRYR